jgi:ribonucleotide reductase beta subunit family protein with ferritin-like domain
MDTLTPQQRNKAIIQCVNQLDKLTKKSSFQRYSLFPIQDESAFEFYKKQEAAIWSANEMEFTRDKNDYDRLEPRLKRLVDMILGFFAPADGLVSQNIAFRFLLECDTFEEMASFITQFFIELVHSENYGMQIMSCVPDEVEQKKIFEMCEELPCVKQKVEWMNKYLFSDEPRLIRLAAFAAAEGVFFSVLFAIIFWFRSKGILQNFIFMNEQISKDEGMHRDYGCYLFRKELSKGGDYVPEGWKDKVTQLLDEALEVELEFLKVLVPEPIDDLNFEDLSDYAKVVTDHLRYSLGLPLKYNVKNKLTWMNDISLSQKGNFYEVRIGSYKNFSVKDALNWKKRCGIDKEESVSVYDNPELFDI